MSSSDDKPRVLKTDLLDELQSIKGLLVDPADTGSNQRFEFEHLDDDLGDQAPRPGANEELNRNNSVDQHQDHELKQDQTLDVDLELDLEQELDLDRELDIDIPILDDVVAARRDKPGGLLNLDEIFNPHPVAVFPLDTDASKPLAANVAHVSAVTDSASDNSRYPNQPSAGKAVPPDIVFLIQELVDEFIPLIEDRLRIRLSDLHPDILQDLAQKHLNP